MKNKLIIYLGLAFMTLAGGAATVMALDTSSALYTSNLQIFNLGITRQNFAHPTEVSGSALIDDAFIEADTLNAAVHEGAVQVASMPPNNRIIVEGAVVDDGGSFTEFTTAAQNATELDTALLPLSPAVDDASYFGCDNPCRILTVDIGQEGIGDWAVDWEYFNGTSFVTASNVDDRTNAFQLAGQRTVTFDMPTDMATSTITGSAVDAYWVRARVTSVSTSTQQAVANQDWYENGQWWTWGKSQSINEEILQTLSLGGADLVTNHQLFPGAAGIVTPDDASIELGTNYQVHFEGSINFTAGVTGSTVCIVCKDGAFRLYISDLDEVTVDVTGAGTTSISLGGIPDSATLSLTGSDAVSPHMIDVFSDGTDLTLSVDGVGSVTGAAQDVTDNGNSYQWGSNGGFIYANKLFILPDETSLAFALFDSESDWDTGTVSSTQSTAGQPNEELSYVTQSAVEDGRWIEVVATFQNTQTNTSWGSNLLGFGVGSNENAFFRFDDVAIDQGTTITAANLQFIPTQAQSGATVNATISAIDADDAASPTTFAGAEGATRTAASVAWSAVPAFTHVTHIAPTSFDSPDITSVVQEIIDRPGWVSGSGIVIYVEDNGSTNGTGRLVSTVEEHHSATQLKITTLATSAITDDFIELATSLTTPQGWTRTCGTCTGAWLVDETGARYGRYAARPNTGPSNNSFDGLTQNITATPGQVWSASVHAVNKFSSDNGAYRLYMRWLDSGGGTISETSASIATAGSPAYTSATINAQTAPALTASLQIRLMEESCGVFGCNGNAYPNLWDAVMACVCAVAPTFPDSSNQVVNPSFESIYAASGTWTTPTINLTQTEVVGSSVVWDAITPFTASLAVETSIDAQASWQAVTNGGAISGINPGDDVSGGTLHIRVSMGPNAGDENIYSPSMGLLAAILTGNISEDNADLYYELRTTPGVTIDDLSPNANVGTMSYPVRLAGMFSQTTPLQSTRSPLSQQAAIGVGDFAAPVTGSGANINLFGNDPGTFLPGGDVINDAFTGAGFPVEIFWVGLVMIVGIIVGGIVWRVMEGRSREFAASIVLAVTLVVAAALGDGLIAGWVPFVTILMLAAYNMLRSRLPI